MTVRTRRHARIPHADPHCAAGVQRHTDADVGARVSHDTHRPDAFL
jgi:hypothetical protein